MCNNRYSDENKKKYRGQTYRLRNIYRFEKGLRHCRPILLRKLSGLGITGTAYKLIESYLTNRQQIVKIDKYQSATHMITFGVPQGSILGPLLFLIYTNNISELSLHGELTLYADDTSIFYFGHSLQDISKHAQQYLNTLNRWFQSNLLTINIQKTHYIIFKAKNKKIKKFTPLSINNIEIKKTNTEKYLGLTLDSVLTWTVHVENIKSKLSPLLGSLRGIFGCLPRSVCHILLTSSVKSNLSCRNMGSCI